MDKIAVFYDNETQKNKIEYVFDFIFSHYFIKKQKIEVIYNPKNNDDFSKEIYYQRKNSNNGIYIKPQKLIFSEKIVDSSNLKSNFYTYKEMTLYSVESEKKEKRDFINNSEVQFDIIETIFFHISRYEEYYAKKNQQDHHERMKSSEQFLVRKNLYKIPVVDHIVYVFLTILGYKKLNIKTIYAMTHDIDAIRKYPSFYKFLRAFARIAIKEKKISKLLILTKQYINTIYYKKDPYDTFDWLIPLNKSNEKIIYFMSGGKTKYDNFYDIEDKRLHSIFDLVKNNHYTIGLHPSYATSYEKNQFKKEIDAIERTTKQKIIKTRQHILHFSFKETIDILEELNITFDSTLGYQDLVGFRCGTGHDYHLYNFNNDRISTVIETPLVVMDGPLLMEGKYNIKESKKIIFNFLNKNNKFTKITFNFHNSTFDDIVCDAIELKKLYIDINNYLKVG
jgi:hypothetical protein